MTYVLIQWHFGVGNPGNVTRGKGQGLADVGLSLQGLNHLLPPFSALGRGAGSGTGIELIRVLSSKSAAGVPFSHQQL